MKKMLLALLFLPSLAFAFERTNGGAPLNITGTGDNYITGKLGVGVTPSAQLHVRPPAGSYGFMLEGASESVDNFLLQNRTLATNWSKPFKINQWNNGRTILNNYGFNTITLGLLGDVGINDITPDARFDITSDGVEANYQVAVSSNDDSTPPMWGTLGDGRSGVKMGATTDLIFNCNVANQASIENSGTGATAVSVNGLGDVWINCDMDNNGTTNAIEFGHNGRGSGGTAVAVISEAGNMGLGTVSPNSAGFGGSVLSIAGPSEPAIEIRLENDLNTNTFAGEIAGIEGTVTKTRVSSVRFVSSGTNETAGNITFNTKNESGTLTERMRICANGQVGISTAVPTVGTMLDVAGVINADDYWTYSAYVDRESVLDELKAVAPKVGTIVDGIGKSDDTTYPEGVRVDTTIQAGWQNKDTHVVVSEIPLVDKITEKTVPDPDWNVYDDDGNLVFEGTKTVEEITKVQAEGYEPYMVPTVRRSLGGQIAWLEDICRKQQTLIEAMDARLKTLEGK